MPGYELFGAEERKEVNDVLQTGILMRYGFDKQRQGNWKTKELEENIAKTFGCGYAQLTTSGSAALTTAMAALGIGYGDEVILPVFTFVATFEAVINTGAIPVLVDVDDTLTLDPAAVEAAITPRTRCLIPVHMCGAMADLDAILKIARQHHLLVLEDACQSIGAQYKGKFLGTIGDCGAFSFDFVKTITCGEGGVVLTNDVVLHDRAENYADSGHDHKGIDRGHDLHPYLGTNYRMNELNAAVGLAQLRKLDRFLAIQRHNFSFLKKALSAIPEVSFRRIPDEAGDSCSFLNWYLPTEEITRAFLKEASEMKMGGHAYWFDNNWHYIRMWDHLKDGASLIKMNDLQLSALAELKKKTFPASDGYISRCISSSISLTWTEQDLEKIAHDLTLAINKALAKA